MSAYNISPIDTLFFRDGKPFTMGEDSEASGYWPAPPSVLYGMLRTSYSVTKQINLKNIVRDTAHLQIQDIQYRYKNNHYLPAPLDLILDKNTLDLKDELPNSHLLKLEKIKPSTISNHPFAYLLKSHNQVVSSKGYLISVDEMKRYLNGSTQNHLLFNPHINHLWDEAKTGIGRNYQTKVTEQGRLYRFQLKRTKNFSILFRTNLSSDEDILTLNKLGGEGKTVNVQKESRMQRLAHQNSNDAVFKIVFTTPTFLRNGSTPDFSRHPVFNKFNIKVLASAIGPKFMIGGYDMVKRRPKPGRFAIPGGSVFYCRIDGSEKLSDLISDPDLPSTLCEASVDEINRGIEGFGIYLIGKVKLSEND